MLADQFRGKDKNFICAAFVVVAVPRAQDNQAKKIKFIMDLLSFSVS